MNINGLGRMIYNYYIIVGNCIIAIVTLRNVLKHGLDHDIKGVLKTIVLGVVVCILIFKFTSLLDLTRYLVQNKLSFK